MCGDVLCGDVIVGVMGMRMCECDVCDECGERIGVFV